MLQYLSVAVSLGALVCYIMVVIQMFQHGKTGPGLASTLGLLACGLGVLFAFIYGWTKVGEWRIKNLMLAWTALIVLNIGISVVTIPGQIQAARDAVVKQQNAANEAVRQQNAANEAVKQQDAAIEAVPQPDAAKAAPEAP